LRAYTEIRDRLADELGIDPGPALRELQARILAQDPSLGPASQAPAQVVAPPEAAGDLGDSPVPGPLLETKLYVPRSRRGLVPRPRLSEPEEVEVRLRDAERWLEEAAVTDEGSLAPPGEMVVADEDEYRRLPGAIELYRSALALVRGDVPGTVRHARRTLDLALTGDHGVRAGAAGFLGLAFWTSGDLEAAHPAWAQCAAGLRQSGQIADIFGCAIAMADIRLVQGRLGEAMRTYDQALQRASEQDGTRHRNPGASGARAPGTWAHPGRADLPGTGPDAG
jgi:tetratricopeptide (TPR) repeat protein